MCVLLVLFAGLRWRFLCISSRPRSPVALILHEGSNDVREEDNVGNKGGQSTGVRRVATKQPVPGDVVGCQGSGKEGDAEESQLKIDSSVGRASR